MAAVMLSHGLIHLLSFYDLLLKNITVFVIVIKNNESKYLLSIVSFYNSLNHTAKQFKQTLNPCCTALKGHLYEKTNILQM